MESMVLPSVPWLPHLLWVPSSDSVASLALVAPCLFSFLASLFFHGPWEWSWGRTWPLILCFLYLIHCFLLPVGALFSCECYMHSYSPIWEAAFRLLGICGSSSLKNKTWVSNYTSANGVGGPCSPRWARCQIGKVEQANSLPTLSHGRYANVFII